MKLQCCPNLLSPVLFTNKCPESCFVQTKTKYSNYCHQSPRKPRLEVSLPNISSFLLFCSLLLREEEETAQANSRRGGSRGGAGQANTPQEEEESYICAEEKTLVSGGLHPRWLARGQSPLLFIRLSEKVKMKRTIAPKRHWDDNHLRRGGADLSKPR